SQALAIQREIPVGGNNYIGNLEGLARQCRDGLTRALDDLKTEELTPALGRIIEAEKADRAEAAVIDPKQAPGNDRAGRKSKKRDQAVDLMVLVHPRELDKAELRSLLAE